MAVTLMSRDHVLHKVRTALGRSAGQPAPPAPPVRLRVPLGEAAPSGPGRVDLFLRNVEGLAGKPYLAGCASAARDYVAELVRGRAAVASNEPLLEEIGITALEGVRSRFAGAEDLRAACASA
ncbi:MAG: hypothetical protein FJW37_08330, partial [Acidobacteria bacterium]|nr:hypothetical protein [Acidobacteriota bacterium]